MRTRFSASTMIPSSPPGSSTRISTFLCDSPRATAAAATAHAPVPQACGTGACAVAAAAVARGESQRNVEILVELPGGELGIIVDAENRVRMRGPAELVFVGEV